VHTAEILGCVVQRLDPTLTNAKSCGSRQKKERAEKTKYLQMKLNFYNHALHSGQLPILDRQEHWMASGLTVPDVAVMTV
jgi:hypothetical protein